MNDDKRFLMWSIEKAAWWRPLALGYTTTVAEAGIFDEKEARERERRGVPGVHGGSVAVPLEQVETAARAAALSIVHMPGRGHTDTERLDLFSRMGRMAENNSRVRVFAVSGDPRWSLRDILDAMLDGGA